MKTKNLDITTTKKCIEQLTKRIDFNNRLNAFVRKYIKSHNIEHFNGYQDVATDDMRVALEDILREESWMSNKMKENYMSYCTEIFGQVYSPAVNTYVLKDLHDCEKHLNELESALESGDEVFDDFKVVRDLTQNRMNIIFEHIPDESVRKSLKSFGFRWSPHLEAWTRQLTPQAEKSLEMFKKQMLDK